MVKTWPDLVFMDSIGEILKTLNKTILFGSLFQKYIYS